jgi:hypothetical protein
MSDRNKFVIAFRGATLGALNAETLSDEIFQNQTLRPILKLQNDIYLEVFKNYISKSKLDFNNFSIEKKMQFIENSILKDINFQNILKGISIGLFTIDEYLIYSKNSSNLNKRLMSMLIERLKSQIQLF